MRHFLCYENSYEINRHFFNIISDLLIFIINRQTFFILSKQSYALINDQISKNFTV